MKLLCKDRLKDYTKMLKPFFVAKEPGKGLSTNDYTDGEKKKLQSVEDEAEKMGKEIETIAGAMGTIAEAVEEIDEEVGILAEETGTLSEEIGTLSGKVETISGEVGTLEEKTEQLEEKLESQAQSDNLQFAIKNTTEKAAMLHIMDSAEMKLQDLKLYGKSEQGENPTPDNPQEIVNAGRYNAESDKYEIDVKVTGKNLFDVEFLRRTQGSWLKNSYYYLPIKVKKGSKISFSIRDLLPLGLPFYVVLNKEKGTGNNAYAWLYHSTGVNLINQKGSFIAIDDEIYLSFAVSQVPSEIDSLFERIFDTLQIEINEEPTPYEPYKEQYIAITSDRTITKFDKLEKRDGVYGWVYSGVLDTDVRFSRTEMFPYGLSLYKDHGNGVYTYTGSNVKKEIGFQTSLCERFANNDGSYNKSDLWNYSDHPSLERQYFTTNFPTVDEFVQWVEENPLTMCYKSKETEFIPLSEDEQKLLSELSTYYPTTIVTNSEGTDMEGTYVADTKNYIERKVEAKVNYVFDLYANTPVVIPELENEVAEDVQTETTV